MTALSSEQIRADERKRREATLELLAKEAEVEALAKRDEIIAEVVAEHERQIAGYSIECARFGTFVKLDISRLGNPSTARYPEWGGTVPERFLATSVNSVQCRAISLLPGHAPDCLGALGYIDGSLKVPSVTADYPRSPYARPLFAVVPPEERRSAMMYAGTFSYQIRYRTPNYPRPAEDDRIVFEGLNATLYIPAGMGQSVHEQILRVT